MIENDKISSFKFPAGEVQVKYNISILDDHALTTFKIRDSDDIICLIQFLDFYKYSREKYCPKILIPYLPFSRMDRKISNYAFSLRAFADLLNNYDAEIYTVDVHSNAASFLIKTFINIDPINYQNSFLGYCDARTLIIPDLGAYKRYPELLKLNEFNNSIVQCNKIRDSSGNITKTEVYGNVKDKNCIIFDDICDGGATFIELAKKLKEQEAGKLFLFVTHGIFSKGLDELFNYYDIIGCTDSLAPYEFASKYLHNFKVISL
jgi:ribose-phosphate pyrophosphokinase